MPLPVAMRTAQRSRAQMTATPPRIGNDDLERIVLTNIAEFGWHVVNVIEDDGDPP